ncbi:bifunctional 2-polyprenyl-6-hydroxyphenol methylase/3-demethylubiquinol 3-O-methyltransferase UbiG [Thiotrichales bacterium 19S11-10]|nr:bifunctional 2-polyprenyl-6-hydroxyphenol methylase/3-demethylubiquinol 3-O-methyltransferase UbiG [Thiotrichales bacterium 19S11-10]
MNVDTNEIEKFSDLSNRWWDKAGDLWTLHKVNPIRLDFIKRQVDLNNKQVLDVGCGGGILSEAIAALGANVTGLDLSEELIQVAKEHSCKSNLNIDYICQSVESLAKEKLQTFDVITSLEMLEHVPDPQTVIRACADLLKPGGYAFFSTLNRNIKSYLFAIVAAEYIMNIIPKGTHQYQRFIKPSELMSWTESYGLKPINAVGIHYNPLFKSFKLGKNIDVNYILAVQKES